jgi:integrase
VVVQRRAQVRRRSTAIEYKRLLRHWMRWQLTQPGEPSSTPTLRGARSYIAELRGSSQWTAYSASKALRAWARFLLDDGITEVDVLATLANLAQPETTNTPVAELADIEAMLATCDSETMEGSRDAALISLLRCTGLRRSEVIGLRWDDVDFAANVIHLPPETTKNGRARAVAFDASTRRALRRYRRSVDRRELSRGRDLSSWHNQVWVSKSGLFTASGLTQMLDRRSRQAGVTLPSHAFRRSIAVRWLRSGHPESLLMNVTGWSSPSMVRRYTAAVAVEESIKVQRAMLEAEQAGAQRRLRAV